MTRIIAPALAAMNEEQQRIYAEIARARHGHVPAPLQAWLVSPELASRAQKLGEFVRYNTSLAPRLSELAILTLARYWNAQYALSVHLREALNTDLAVPIIEAIAARQRPQFINADEQIVYDFIIALNESHAVPDNLYNAAIEALSEQGVVELVGLLGYYTFISMTVNVFEIDAPIAKKQATPDQG